MSNPRRRGVSLAELLVVMAAASAVLTLSTMLIHRAMQSHTRTQHRLETERGAWRLSHQLHRDARLATQAEVLAGEEPTELRLTTGDKKTIRYRFESQTVLRTEQTQEAVDSEHYAFPAPVDWAVSQSDHPPSFVISSGPVPPSTLVQSRIGAPLRMHIEATLAPAEEAQP